MVKNLVFLIFLLLSITNENIIAQENAIGIEAGNNFYQFQISDTANGAFNLPRDGRTSFGINYMHSFKSNIIIEGGLFYNRYIQQYGTSLYEFGHEEVYNCWVIPIKVGYGFKLLDKRLNLIPFIGYAQGIKTTTYINDYYQIIILLDQGGIRDSITRGTFYYNQNRFFPLLNVGGRVVYSITPHFQVSAVWEYYHGYAEVGKAEFLYNNGSGINDHYAEQTGQGTYSSWRIGVHYAFGKGVVTKSK